MKKIGLLSILTFSSLFATTNICDSVTNNILTYNKFGTELLKRVKSKDKVEFNTIPIQNNKYCAVMLNGQLLGINDGSTFLLGTPLDSKTLQPIQYQLDDKTTSKIIEKQNVQITSFYKSNVKKPSKTFNETISKEYSKYVLFSSKTVNNNDEKNIIFYDPFCPMCIFLMDSFDKITQNDKTIAMPIVLDFDEHGNKFHGETPKYVAVWLSKVDNSTKQKFFKDLRFDFIKNGTTKDSFLMKLVSIQNSKDIMTTLNMKYQKNIVVSDNDIQEFTNYNNKIRKEHKINTTPTIIVIKK